MATAPRTAASQGLRPTATPLRRAAALALGLCAAWPAEAEGARRKFLVIYGNQSTLAANAQITEGATAEFDARLPDGYDLYAEYRDVERFPGAEHDRRFAEEIAAKYAGLDLDAVMAVGPAALPIAVETVAAFAPETPVVFGAVGRDTVRGMALPATFGGVLAEFDLAGTLRLARALQPDARRVVVISGSAPFDRAWEATARGTFAAVADIPVDYVAGLTVAGFEGVADAVEPDAIVIVLTVFEDAAGERFIPRDVAARIAQRARAPVYGIYSSYVGDGVVGGVFATFEALGGAMARQAVDAAENPGVPPATVEAPVVAMVDWRQIERFGLDWRALPPDAVALNRQVGLWERYRLQILLTLAVILAQTATIAALVVQGRRRRRAEAAATARRLELAHMSRVAQIGELSGALAHELNQPLAAILSNAEAGERLLARTPPDLAEVRAILADIVEDDRRAAAVVADLRTLIANGAPDLADIDLNDVVASTLRLAGAEMRMRGVSVETRLERGRLAVRGNKAQLQQVLINLMVNAADAMAGLDVEERRMSVETALRADGGRELAVRDGGPGVPGEMIDGAFRPFRTTKPDGLGLGLSICRTIAEGHGGTLAFDAGVNRGARAVLALPAP